MELVPYVEDLIRSAGRIVLNNVAWFVGGLRSDNIHTNADTFLDYYDPPAFKRSQFE